MGSFGWGEMLLVAVVIILLFGARKLPELGRGLGEGIRSFRNAMKGEDPDPGKKDQGPTGGNGK
jgi:sec-independent protein translocase protein TatA